MEEKRIGIQNVDGIEVGCAERRLLGYYLDNAKFIGAEDLARKYAHAILELIGDPVPRRGDHNYIAVEGDTGLWANGRILSSCSTPAVDPYTALENASQDEYHIFRRVATVGPIPQPERKVTRYD